MKKFALVLLFLVACTAPVKENPPATNITVQSNLTLRAMIDEFAKIDSELNTSWHEEEIPRKLISPAAIEPWTQRLIVLKNTTEPDSFPDKLVEARLNMLKSQAAYYLGATVGAEGALIIKGEEGKFTVTEKINCERLPSITKATQLYALSFAHWLRFVHFMDDLLQKSDEAKELIGTNLARPKFYTPTFADAGAKINATVTAVKQQCGYDIPLPKEARYEAKPSM